MALLLGDLAGRQNKNNQNNFMTWTILQELCAVLKKQMITSFSLLQAVLLFLQKLRRFMQMCIQISE